MENTLKVLNGVSIATNKLGDKVEQKQGRAIKAELIDAFVNYAKSNDLEIMYENESPVIAFDNGLIVGFDFNVKALNTDLSVLPVAKPKPKKASK